MSDRTRNGKADDGTRAFFVICGLVAAATAVATGWSYSRLYRDRETVVIDTAKDFLELLFVASYIAIGAAVATVIIAALAWFGAPVFGICMPVVHGIIALAWGLAWLFSMIAEISIAKQNEACKDIAGDRFVNGQWVWVCYQGDWLNWLPTYAVTVVSFVGSLIFLGFCVSTIRKWRPKKTGFEQGLAIVVGDEVIPLGEEGSRSRVDEAAERLHQKQVEEREEWVEQQMRMYDMEQQQAAGALRK